MSGVFVDFDECKVKISIQEVLDVLGIADQFQQRNGMLRAACPFPAHQHNPVRPNPNQFTIREIDGIWMWKCWGDCQASGTVVTFVTNYLQLSPAHARLWFHEHFANRLTATAKSKKRGVGEHGNEKPPSDAETRPAECPQSEAATSVVYASSENKCEDYKPIRFTLRLEPNVPYLKGRGVSDETVARFGIGLCNRGMLKGYVAIPVWEDPRGTHPYGYLGRWAAEDYDSDDDRPRYKWPAGFPKNRFVYGLREALDADDGLPLIVVEGPFKVYHLLQHGYPNTVATFGSSLSDQQAERLIATGRPIVLIYDGDEAGRAGMRAAVEKLVAGTFVRTVELADGIEPDQLDVDNLRQTLDFIAPAV